MDDQDPEVSGGTATRARGPAESSGEEATLAGKSATPAGEEATIAEHAAAQAQELSASVEEPRGRPEKVTLVVHSGDFDKIYSAFIIGTGALSMGMDVSMYFTFWGLGRLKRGRLASGPLSKMNMLGLGKQMVLRRMRKQNVRPLDQLAQDFKDLGGKIFACDMTMDIMGIQAEELQQELIEEYCAVGTYIREARESTVTLFI
jgi:peroxiredoxin family protein